MVVRAGRSLNLSRVFELGVRRGVHHHVARLNLSKFFRLRGLPRGWENSYPMVLAVKDRAKQSVSGSFPCLGIVASLEVGTPAVVELVPPLAVVPPSLSTFQCSCQRGQYKGA